MNKTQNIFQTYKIWLALAAVAVAVAAMAFLGIRASAGTYDAIGIEQKDNQLIARYDASEGKPQVEKWKYLIREDDTCSGSIFRDGGRDQGNTVLYHRQSDDSPVYVKYNSNVFHLDAPWSEFIADIYIGQYICFQALLTDGSWAAPAGRLIDLTPLPVTGGPDDPAAEDDAYDRDCPDGQYWYLGVGCLPEDPGAEEDDGSYYTERSVSDIGFPHADEVVWESEDEVIVDFIVYDGQRITSVGYGLPDDRIEGCDSETEYDFSNDVDGDIIEEGRVSSGATYQVVRYDALRISSDSGASESTGICFFIKYESGAISVWGTPDD